MVADTAFATPDRFGNWHFGIVGTAQGWSEAALLNGAGIAQLAEAGYEIVDGVVKNPAGVLKSGLPPTLPTGGVPVFQPPYGDDPRDQAWIRAGVQLYSWYAACAGP